MTINHPVISNEREVIPLITVKFLKELGRKLLVQTKRQLATKGKKAESAVKTLFEKLKERHQGLDFIKLKDARSSLGRGASKQVADFQVFTNPNHIAVEVKEVKHRHLLPNDNLSQIPKMTRRAMAGGLTCILVNSTVTDDWFFLTLDWVRARKHFSSYNMDDLTRWDSAEEAWSAFCKIYNIKY